MKPVHISLLQNGDDDEPCTSSLQNGRRAGMPISIIETSQKSSLFNLWQKKNTGPPVPLKDDLLDDDDFRDIPQIWTSSNLPAHQKAHLTQFYNTYFARANALRSYEAETRKLNALVAHQRQSIADLEFAMCKTHYSESAKESAFMFDVDLSPVTSPRPINRSQSTDSGFDEEELIEQVRLLKTENSFLRQSVEEVLTCIAP